jgi:hypothetical protein
MDDKATPARSAGEASPPIDAYVMQNPQPQSGSPPNEGLEEAERLKTAAADRARMEAEKRKHGVAEDLDEVSSALRDSGDKIEGADWARRLLGEAAEQLQHAAQSLEGKSPDALMQDLRGFARRNPAVYLAGCAALGFAASRIARAQPQGDGRYGNA